MDVSELPSVPFTVTQAVELGLTPARLRRWCRAGFVRRLLRGVYLRADLTLTMQVKLAAAALVISPNAVACDRTAAWIWDVDAFSYGELDVVPPLETFVLRGGTRTRRTETCGGVRDLTVDDWVEVDGVKVTTPVRTALDLGCSLNRREALAAMDALARSQIFTSADLNREIRRYFRRRGVVQLRQLVPLVRPEAESPRESWMRLEMHDFGLPAPELQWWVDVDGVPTYRLDLAYPRARIAIEYDGKEHHASIEDRARDEARRTWLRAQGWTVIVVDASAFAPGADLAWLVAVRDALADAHRRPRRIYARS
jgi:hypothetical protein